MNRKIILAVVAVVLALSAGVAYAATQTASGGTNVCVNNTNGLLRAAETCRDGEHPLTIGGGGTTQATQNGTFTVPWGETGGGKVLPLTGVTLSGRCEVFPLPFGTGDGANARLLIDAPAGQTMDVFPSLGQNPTGVSSLLLAPASSYFGMPTISGGTQNAIVAANAATATITMGGYVDLASRTCKFLWQAIETPN